MTFAEELGAEWWRAMLAGSFEHAWRVNDRLREMRVEDRHRFWQGEDFNRKRVIVRCLHGFGDSIQFLRYLPQLQERAASVCVEVAPKFEELAKCLVGIGALITWGHQAPLVAPEWDVQMEVMELPYVFRTQLHQLPLAQGYLRIRAADRSAGTRPQVALAWTAGEWNPARRIPFPALSPILEVSGCVFWNLAAELAPREAGRAIYEDEQCRETLVGLARRIAAADLVITVDTIAAHIAGAMGVPAWLMLRHDADWRWMSGREDSPWYPSIRLIRQSRAGDWKGVIEQLATRLADFVDSWESRRRSGDQETGRDVPSPESLVRLGC